MDWPFSNFMLMKQQVRNCIALSLQEMAIICHKYGSMLLLLLQTLLLLLLPNS